MEKIIYIIIGLIAFVYYYSVGVYFVLKKLGVKDAGKAFIPFYAFSLLSKETYTFTIFTIPIKKYSKLIIMLFTVAVGAFAYGFWGDINLPELSIKPLWEIMYLIIFICFFCVYVSLINSTNKLMLRFKVEKTIVITLLAATLIGLPIAYYLLSKKELRII